MTHTVSNRKGWLVTFSGTGINLALGVLYTWSVIKAAIPVEWGWTAAQKSDPYAIACFVFAIAMIPAGRLQDKIGPRWVATIGGVAVALGCIIAGSGRLQLSRVRCRFRPVWRYRYRLWVCGGYTGSGQVVSGFPDRYDRRPGGCRFWPGVCLHSPHCASITRCLRCLQNDDYFRYRIFSDRGDPGAVSAKPACRLRTV